MSFLDGHNFNVSFPAPVAAPEFPPPLFRQPPSPGAIRQALSNPPFSWNGISLRVFRCPSSLADFAELEERGDFLNPEHKHWYKLLKAALEKDLEDLKRHHKVETEMEPSLRAYIEKQETIEFHDEFMAKLQWGEESSPLLLRPANYLDDEGDQTEDGVGGRNVLPDKEFHKAIMKFKKRGLKTDFPSIRTFFENYPGPSVAWAVQDFYKRQESTREAAKVGLEFQQSWEWSERHWNFFEAASKLREWVRKETRRAQKCSSALVREYDAKALNWNPAIESHKRRHQWAVLKRIMRAYESRDEKFPEINAPAGRSFDRYFGKYGRKEGWYPVDKELDSESAGESVIMQQIDGAENVLEAGGSLAVACAGAVDGCAEGSIRRKSSLGPPSRTVEEADALLVRMRLDADVLLASLRSEVRTDTAAAEPTLDTVEELPDPTDDSNGDAKVNTQSFLSSLRQRLIGEVFVTTPS